MNPRHDLIDLFSTFAQFVDDRLCRWVKDGSLRRNMQRSQAAGMTDPSEAFWALHWHRSWQKGTELAEGHLSAYLQEPCYWASRKMAMQQINLSLVPDYFQAAIATLPKVLKGYSPDQGASLKTYATLRFGNALRDSLRQNQEVQGRTDWGLLRRVSQKCFVESLYTAGLSEQAIARDRLAWTCFKTLYAPSDSSSTRQLARPDDQTWRAIAQRYNQQRYNQQSQTLPEQQPNDLERCLKESAKRIRQYLCPPTTSLNVKKFDDGSGELQDNLPDQSENTLLETLIAQEELQERQAQKTQVGEVLTAALAQLEPQIQTLLALYYSQEWTQQQIAQKLEMKQYTISRRLSSSREQLLTAIARWSQETLHISLTSAAVQQMGIVLEEWLQAHYCPQATAAQEDRL
jgi:RNA polymerase sigma factor (sigma-70 family)